MISKEQFPAAALPPQMVHEVDIGGNIRFFKTDNMTIFVVLQIGLSWREIASVPER